MIKSIEVALDPFVQRPRLLRYLYAVGIPTLAVLFYLAVLARDGYVSRADVMVEHGSSLSAAAPSELSIGLLAIGSQSSKLDVLVVETFMRSRTMLEYLDAKLDLRGHFSSATVDVVGKLDPDVSTEDFLEYYRDHLSTVVNEDTNVLSVEFVAHDPAYARSVTENLVQRSEEFVNEVVHGLAREQLKFASSEITRAEERLQTASREMIKLQRQYEVFSPEGESQATGTVMAGLMQELAKARIEYGSLLSYLNPGAAEVVAAQARISALEKQLSNERGRLVGGAGNGLNDVMLAYQDAQANLTLATEIYKTALTALETTRLEAIRKTKYLVMLSSPSLPDSVERPRILYWTLTIFIFLNLAYFVMSLIIATIQDHRE